MIDKKEYLQYIQDRQMELDRYLNYPEWVKASLAFCSFGRQLGKTTNMINRFPNDRKFTVVLWTSYMKELFMDRVAKERPDIDLNNMEILKVRIPQAWEDLKKIKELRGTENLFIDNAVWDAILDKQIKELFDLA